MDVKLVSRIFFLKSVSGSENAEALRNVYNLALSEKFNSDLDSFMRNLTFVNDCGAEMLCIVGASASSRRVTQSKKWMRCVSHMLNSAIKHEWKLKLLVKPGFLYI